MPPFVGEFLQTENEGAQMTEKLWKLDAWKIAELVRSGDVSAKEVLEVFLERIDEFNADLNAFVYLDADRARTEAAEIDKRVASGEDPGPLSGVPIGVKDLEDVVGMPTTHGSVIYKDNIANRDTTEVTRLRASGCVIVGKTAAPDFGAAAYTSTELHGTTRNPWALDRTPGGSSGGSAAAVASALVPIATGSDGGGSIRIPASYSGLLGMKVSYGRIPRGGSPDSSYTSVLGCMSRSVKDAARFIDCVMGPDEADQFALPHPGMSYEKALEDVPGNLKAVWSQDLGYGTCAKEVAEIAKAAAGKLRKAGVFDWTDGEVELTDMSRAWGLLGAPSSWARHKSYWDERKMEIAAYARVGLEWAIENLDVKQMAESVERRWINNQRLAETFEKVDLIVTPTTSTTAFAAEGPMPTEIDGVPLKRPMHAITFTFPFNISGHPAVSIPCGLDRVGLPVGLQLVARRHQDHLLLAIAAEFERLSPWPKIATRYA